MNLTSSLNKVNRVKRPSKKSNSIKYRKTGRLASWFKSHEGLYDYELKKGPSGFISEDELKDSRYYLSYADGARLIELKRKLGKKPDNLGKLKGDVINGYSRESRNRFLKYLLSVNYNSMGAPLFYTLTYPGEYSNDPRVWKRDLMTFIKRLNRLYGDMCGTWRLEPQKRGAPHFCGFLWGCKGLETMEGKKMFSRMWFEVVGSGDEKHLRAGTGIEKEEMILKRIYYQAKYQTKDEKGGVKQEFDYPVGRYWGIFNREKIVVRMIEFEIDKNLFFKVRRVIRKKIEKCVAKNKHNEVIKGKSSGLWYALDDKTILKLLDLILTNEEREDKIYAEGKGKYKSSEYERNRIGNSYNGNDVIQRWQ